MAITKLASKCARGINEQLLKTSGADVLSSVKKEKKKNRKTSEMVATAVKTGSRSLLKTKSPLNGLFFELTIEKRLISVLVLLRGE